MSKFKPYDSMSFLNSYRGDFFQGEWPTVPEMFNISVSRFPERACFTDFEGENGAKRCWTYTESLEVIKKISSWLLENGVSHGDRVAVSGKNSPEWAMVYLAALYAGAIICPIDFALHTEEIGNLLDRAEPKFLFIDDEKYSFFAEKKTSYGVYSLNPKQNETYVLGLDFPSETVEPKEPCLLSETAAILFTSGTTGIPKGVMLSHKNLVSDVYIAQTNMKIFETDVFYALLPIHHAYTMLAVFLEAISVGAEIVFARSMAVSKMMRELKEGKITMLLGVPMLFNKLAAGIIKGIKAKGAFVYGILKFLMGFSYFCKKAFGFTPCKKLFHSVLDKASIATIRIAICGGGPLAKKIFKFYNQLGINFVQGYGLTETSPIVTLNPIEHFKIESVGRYFAEYMEMKIDSPNEEGIGEIFIKGPMVMQGYYKMPEETREVLSEDGWLRTGDLGWIDKEDYVMLSGRSKNMIVTEGGKNVYPEEIEDSFQLETDIQQITVQGYLSDKEMQAESLEALIYPSDDFFKRIGLERGDKSDSAEKTVYSEISDIVEKINKRLRPYQKIERIHILDKPLEMTTTLKVKRKYKN